MSQIITCYALIVSHRHGQNITVHPSEEAAKAALADFVDDWWEAEEIEDEKPSDREEMVDIYFDQIDEQWAIDRCSLALDEDTIIRINGAAK